MTRPINSSLSRAIDMLLFDTSILNEESELMDATSSAVFIYQSSHLGSDGIEISYKVNRNAQVVFVEQRRTGGGDIICPDSLTYLVSRVLKKQGIVVYEDHTASQSNFPRRPWVILVGFAGMLLSACACLKLDGAITIELHPPC